MARYWAVAATVLALLLIGFLVAEAFDLPVLADPTARLASGGVAGALLAVALLTADAVLPVPASLVMVAAGALYGAVGGALLALLGRVLGALVGYAIGRRGGPLVARLVPRDGRERADALLRRWGAMAIVATRPVPLLAETVRVMAGVSSIGWGRVALAALVGSIPEAVLYAGAAPWLTASRRQPSSGWRWWPWSASSGSSADSPTVAWPRRTGPAASRTPRANRHRRGCSSTTSTGSFRLTIQRRVILRLP